jgi:hypothetical protein
MIKTGDKLRCIRTDYIDSNNHYAELTIKIGDFYSVESVNYAFNYIIVNGWAFGIDEEEPKMGNLRYYKHYFMTYNEWLALERERQIKTILDD